MTIQQRPRGSQEYIMNARMTIGDAWEMWRGLMLIGGISSRYAAEVQRVADGVLRHLVKAQPGDDVIVIPITWNGAETIYCMTGGVVEYIRLNPGAEERCQVSVTGMIAIRGAMREFRDTVRQLVGMRWN